MSLPFFPPINSTGVMVHRPFVQRPSFSTITQDVPSGMRFSFAEIGAGLTNFPTAPLGRWDLKYASMPDADLANLQAFFDLMEGRVGAFSVLDPGGNLVTASENFSDLSWTGHFTGTATTDPFGGNRATLCGAATISTTVIPSGNAAGFVLCASIYVKPSALGTATVTITLAGSSQAFTIAGGAWRRVIFSVVVPSSGAVTVQFAVPSGVIFGAQCAALPGPGAYRKTPGSEAYKANCRFDVDELKVSKNGPNDNSVSLSIKEHF